MSHTARRHRLNAWNLWYQFCLRWSLSVRVLHSISNPSFLVSEFLLFMFERNTPPSARAAAKSAAVFLLERLTGVRDLGHDRMVMDFTASTASAKSTRPKYKSIWDLSILLDFIRQSPSLRTLSMSQLIARVVALLMIFAMARPIEVLRADPTQQVYSDSKSQLTIPTQRKTDKGKNRSFLTIFRLDDLSICPVAHWEELCRRATLASTSSSSSSFSSSINPLLFRTDSNTPISSSAQLCLITKALLRQASIPDHYSTYSIRHATITKLYALTDNKSQVNAFTGHSNLAGTSSKWYLHQSDNWLGFKLAAAFPSPVASLNRVSENDGAPLSLATLSEGEVSDSEDLSCSEDGSESPPPPVPPTPVVLAPKPPKPPKPPTRASSAPSAHQTVTTKSRRVVKQTILSASSSMFCYY